MLPQKAASLASASLSSFILSSPPFFHLGKISTWEGGVKLLPWGRGCLDREESALLQAGGDGVGQLIGPAIGAEIVGGVTETNRGFILQEIDTGKAAFREFIPGGAGDTEKSGAEFREDNHP